MVKHQENTNLGNQNDNNDELEQTIDQADDVVTNNKAQIELRN